MTTWDDTTGGDAVAGDHLDHYWAHGDLVVLRDGRLVTPAPDTGLFVLEPDGSLAGRIPVDANEIHGLTVMDHEGEDRLWIADCGFAMVRGGDGQFVPGGRGGTRGPRAVLIDLDGNEHRSIDKPDHAAYDSGFFLPTAVAVAGDDVWVADGYGCSLVHRIAADGTLVQTLDGSSDQPGGGAGRFDCPHSVFVDHRPEHDGGAEAELLVADRGNARVQVFGLDGSYRRTVGEGVLTSPSAFATVDDLLVIAELEARVVVLDADGALVREIGANAGVVDRPGWPNAFDADGAPVRPPLQRERFNSPHGLAADADGNLFVSEWLIGGRLVAIRDG